MLQCPLPTQGLITKASKSEGSKDPFDPYLDVFKNTDRMKEEMKRKEERKKMRWEKPVCHMLRYSKVSRREMQHKHPKFFECGVFWGPLTIPEKHVALIMSVLSYFTEDVLREQIVPFVNRDDSIPLRLLGWLVVNYVKEYNVTYIWQGLDGKQKPRTVNVFQGYDALMRRYHRRHFDPFRRRYRIFFEIDDVVYETTIGQLLFLQWAFQDGVVEYTRKHAKKIDTHMFIHTEAKKKEKEEDAANGVRHRRSECVKKKRRTIGFLNFSLEEGESDFGSDDESEVESMDRDQDIDGEEENIDT